MHGMKDRENANRHETTIIIPFQGKYISNCNPEYFHLEMPDPYHRWNCIDSINYAKYHRDIKLGLEKVFKSNERNCFCYTKIVKYAFNLSASLI